MWGETIVKQLLEVKSGIILFTVGILFLLFLNGVWAGREDVVVTPSGLQYVDLVTGSGQIAKSGDMAVVHYTGWLKDGTKFDSSKDRNTPFQFSLGAGEVIKGWDEGVVGMKIGGTRKLIIPPELGYGARGAGRVIPPSSILTFEVELLDLR
jgi:FKBP-type peptidyl-prolyl cis-trans isomerase